MFRLLLIGCLILSSCDKNECIESVSHFTRQKGNDVFKLVESGIDSKGQEDYTDGEIQHIFIVETNCDTY